MNLYLANVNYMFGDNAFLPYSAGRLWAAAIAKPEVRDQWRLAEMLWKREPVERVIRRMQAAPPSLLGLSLYIWSERWSMALAKAVRIAFPRCVLIAGGPQVPENWTEDWALSHGIDHAVLGEGEEVFARILTHFDEYIHRPGQTRVWASSRVDDLSKLYSPYLSGVFDSLIDKNKWVRWQALQETNRGCPYQCTFCDWGSATYSKVRKFDLDTCEAELLWIGHREIELLYNCDANFGMLEQDEQFTDALIETARRTGYPKKFRAAYAKKINDRVFSVAKKISDAGLSKGATISFQSMDASVLRNIKRLNPVEKTLAATFERYREAGIPSYTEIIVGLPGETLTSFKEGIERLLQAGQHEGLSIYPCMALRNSELSKQAYADEFGIQTREVELLLLHGDPGDDPHAERYRLVIGTNDLPYNDWREAWTFGIVVQALHCSGITQAGARKAAESGVRYYDFYDQLIMDAREGPGMGPLVDALGRALTWWDGVLDEALAGGPWRTVLPEFGSIQWPVEEAVRLMVSKDIGMIPDNESPADWARNVVWYGRKGGIQTKKRIAA